MFAKIFGQILDSSIAQDYDVRRMFMDMLILSDSEGVVDMTHDAISRRLNVPLEKVTAHINELMKPDPESRSKKAHGARIALLDSHRDWGWKIVNYAHYRAIRDEEGRRGYFRDYMRDRRAKSRKDKNATLGKNVNSSKHAVKKPSLTNTPVNTGKLLLTHAEAEEEAERKKISSAHAEFIEKWTTAYKEHFSEPYAFQGGKDATAVKLLLASSKKTPAELMRVALAAWKNSQGFFCKAAVSISGFNSKFNEIRQELNQQRNGPHQRNTAKASRTTGTANERRVGQYDKVGKV